MEEMKGNPTLAGGIKLCEEILHFCRGIRIKDDGSNPRGRGEHLHLFLGSQAFPGLCENKKRTKRDRRVRNSIWWGNGSLGLLERQSPGVWARRWRWEGKAVSEDAGVPCSGAQASMPGRVSLA